MVGNDHLGAAAELAQAILRRLGGFDLDIDGMRAAADRQLEDRELLLDAAVEFAVILVAAAGGQDDAFGKLLEKAGDRLRAFARVVQEVQAEFQEQFARLGLAPGVLQQGWNVWHAERNADAGKRPRLRHRKKTPQNNTGVASGLSAADYRGARPEAATTWRRRGVGAASIRRGWRRWRWWRCGNSRAPAVPALRPASATPEAWMPVSSGRCFRSSCRSGRVYPREPWRRNRLRRARSSVHAMIFSSSVRARFPG